MKQVITVEQLTAFLDIKTATQWAADINKWGNEFSLPQCWDKISHTLLTPEYPFALHTLLFQAVYSTWDNKQGPPPAWIPDEKITTTNINGLQQELDIKTYTGFHQWSITHRSAFWKKAIEKLAIIFDKPYSSIVKFENNNVEHPVWLNDAKINIARSCLKAKADKTAIVYEAEQGHLKTMSYSALDKLSNRIANSLMQAGLKKGDACAIDMLMTAEAVAIYLGILKAGCVAVSIADSLAPDEIEKRLRISDTKLLFTQDIILRAGKKLPLYTKVIEAHPKCVVVLPIEEKVSVQLRQEDLVWHDFLNDNEIFEPVSCNPDDVINILFSSGTTGDPKAIPWTHTTAIKAASDGFLHHDIHANNTIAWPTNLGWMMGPWLIFASFINNATMALFYGAPTGREFGEFVQNAKVNMLGVVPSIVKRWKETDCMNGLDWSSIYAYSSTGEASNFYDMLWLMAHAQYKPVIEYCGGTEIGGGYLTGTMVQPASPASFSTPALGLDFILLDENAQLSEGGEIYLIPPSMGLSIKLLNKDHHKIYYAESPTCPDNAKGATGEPVNNELKEWQMRPILRKHGDEMLALGSGYYRAQGRVDDTMNLGGIKVSSAEIERAISDVTGISETAAIAFDPPKGGPSELVIYVVLKPEQKADTHALVAAMQQAIRNKLNPLFKIKDAVVVSALPRTASNKVMRRVLRKQYQEKATIV